MGGLRSYNGAVAAFELCSGLQLDAAAAWRRSEVQRAWRAVEGVAEDAAEEAADEAAPEGEEEALLGPCDEGGAGAAGAVAGTAAAGAVIVYGLSRRIVEALALFFGALLDLPVGKVGAYHAGMLQRLRNANMAGFLSDEVRVMVATRAFELGVNKLDVAGVLVFGEPSTLADFEQQIGRAGRGGQPARCVLLSGDITAPVQPRPQSERPWLAPELRAVLQADRQRGAAELTAWRQAETACRWETLETLAGESPLGPCARCDACRVRELQPPLCFSARDVLLMLQRVSTGIPRAEQAAAAGRLLVALQYAYPRVAGFWQRLGEQLMLAGCIASASDGPRPLPPDASSAEVGDARRLWRPTLTTRGEAALRAGEAGCGGVPLDAASRVQLAEADAHLRPVVLPAEGEPLPPLPAPAAVDVWGALSRDCFEELGKLPVDDRDELLVLAALDERYLPLLDERGRCDVGQLLRDPTLQRLRDDLDEAEAAYALGYASEQLAAATRGAGRAPHPAAADTAAAAYRARRMLILQLVVHVLGALGVCGSEGESGGGGGGVAAAEDGSGSLPNMGMDAGGCRIAGIVTRIAELRGEQFGAAPRGEGQVPSVDLLTGRELRMQRLRLPRQSDGSLVGGLDELAALVHGRRVTTAPQSAALHIEPRRAWGAPRAFSDAPAHERSRPSAGSSSSYSQWREASVPGRAAETFALLPDRPPCPSGSLLRSTQWSPVARVDRVVGAAQVWRFTELEGYREDDVATSEVHAVQTRGMQPGRLAFVAQGHGRISLMLVCAHGATLLVRGLRAQ